MDRTSLGLDAECNDVVNRAGTVGLNRPVLTSPGHLRALLRHIPWQDAGSVDLTNSEQELDQEYVASFRSTHYGQRLDVTPSVNQPQNTTELAHVKGRRAPDPVCAPPPRGHWRRAWRTRAANRDCPPTSCRRKARPDTAPARSAPSTLVSGL